MQLGLSHAIRIGKAEGVCGTDLGKRVEVEEVGSLDLAAAKPETRRGDVDGGDTPKYQHQNRELAAQFSRSGLYASTRRLALILAHTRPSQDYQCACTQSTTVSAAFRSVLFAA